MTKPVEITMRRHGARELNDPMLEWYVPVWQLGLALETFFSRNEVAEVFERLEFAPAWCRSRRKLIDSILSGDHSSVYVTDALLAVKPGFFTCVQTDY